MDAAFFPALCAILDRQVGEVLTPQRGAALARQIMDMLLSDPLDLNSLDRWTVGSYTLQPERLAQVWQELEPMHTAHYQETEDYRRGIPFAPDYPRAIHEEAEGRYVLLTARRDGELVANYGLCFGVSRHTQTGVVEVGPGVHEDSVFIAPAHRNSGRLFWRLVEYAEYVSRHFGARELVLTAKVGTPVAGFLPRLGYAKTAEQFVKIL